MARQHSSTSLAVLALCVCWGMPCASGQGSMMRREAKEARKGKSALQAAFEQVLEGEAAERLLAVEASVRPTYEAFPKSSLGRIPPSEIFPAIVRSYFLKEHGWLIKGLEPPHLAPRPTEVHEALVLRESAPGLAEALRSAREAEQGLSLGDVVGTIAALEHLLLGESRALLQGAYVLNQLAEADALDEDGLNAVLHSYLLLFRHGHPRNLTDVQGHRRMKARAQHAKDWGDLVKFTQDAVLSSGHTSPFSFSNVLAIVRDLALAYGKWQNSECTQMKVTLLGLGANASGTVPLARFHAEPKHASFQFTESAEYLRKVGALEESAEGEPRVLIANYLLGPSNCIVSSEHHSVCCLSECEALTSELEQQVQAPVAPARRLLELVAGLPQPAPPGAAGDLRAELAQDLEAIAGRHEGAVPLHSADFRRWLHAARPGECPLPTAAEGAAEESERLAAEEWLAVQQECTRIPPWHPSASGDVLRV